jgi:hypothetical protein
MLRKVAYGHGAHWNGHGALGWARSRPVLAWRPVVERLWGRPVLALDSGRLCLGLQLSENTGELAPASFPSPLREVGGPIWRQISRSAALAVTARP